MASIGIQMVGEFLRPYQKAWLKDTSRWRSFLKSRRIGVSTGCIGLETVLIASGIYESVQSPDHCNVVSKVDKDAKDVIGAARWWMRILWKDPALRPYLELDKDNETELEFSRTRKHVRSYTQSPGAVRSGNGNFYGDEVAFWPHANAIWDGGVQSIQANPSWRASFVSTPNGTSGMGELFYKICRDSQFDYMSRHEVDIFEAVRQGMPVDPEEIRRGCRNEEAWLQEYCCKFIGAAGEYFDRPFLDSCASTRRPNTPPDGVYIGIDVASVIDLTAVVVLRVIGGVIWICEVFLISRLPYLSSPQGAGQDVLVAALLKHYQPAMAIMDTTGDGSKLYAGVVSKLGDNGSPIIPHVMDQAWKVDLVPDIKGAMERGRVRIDAEEETYHLNHGALDRLNAHTTTLTDEAVATIVEDAFARRDWGSQLKMDFQKVHKKLTASGATTYDTSRDAEGHGDSFWSSAMGYSLCRHLVGDAQAAAVGEFWGDVDSGSVQMPEYSEFW